MVGWRILREMKGAGGDFKDFIGLEDIKRPQRYL